MSIWVGNYFIYKCAYEQRHDPFQENRTSDDFEMDDRVIPSLRAHVPLNNIKSINSSLREESDRKNDTLKRSLSLSDMSYIDKTKVYKCVFYWSRN